jgi:hypothetical protein
MHLHGDAPHDARRLGDGRSNLSRAERIIDDDGAELRDSVDLFRRVRNVRTVCPLNRERRALTERSSRFGAQLLPQRRETLMATSDATATRITVAP